jgi:hypothetical protein
MRLCWPHAVVAPCCCAPLMHWPHAALAPRCTGPLLYKPPAVLAPCCTASALHCLHAVLPPCCTGLLLYRLSAALAPCYTASLLHWPSAALGQQQLPPPTCSHALRSLLSLTGFLVRFSAYSQPSMRCVALNTMLNPPRPSSLTCLNSELQQHTHTPTRRHGYETPGWVSKQSSASNDGSGPATLTAATTAITYAG